MSMRPRNPFNPPLGEGLRRFGFRDWYERELLSSHAHLILLLLSFVGMLGSIEAFAGASPAAKVLDVLLFIASTAIGLWALRRYIYLLLHAEAVANQANCPACGTYARFVLRSEDRETGRLDVRCRACNCEWHIDT